MLKKKSIIAVFIIIIALIGSYFFLINMDTAKDNENDVNDKISDDIVIFSTDKAKVAKISILNKHGDYTFYKAGDSWKVLNLEAAQLILSKVENLAYDVADIKATSLVLDEEGADLSIYGLSVPSSKIIVTLTDDSEHEFDLGDLTPTGTEYYFKDKNKNAIYTITKSKGDTFLQSLNDFRDKSVLDIDTSTITEVIITKKDGATVHVQQDPAGPKDELGVLSYWKILSPYERNASNEEVINRLLNNIASIMAKSYVDDPSNLEKYGLKDPLYTVKVKISGEYDTFYVGEKTEGGRYVKQEGKDDVFVVDESIISFVDLTGYELIERYVALIDINRLQSATITANGKTHTISITGNKDEAKYYLDGNETDEKKFKAFYQSLIGLAVNGELKDAQKEDVGINISFVQKDGTTTFVEFGRYDDRNYSVFVNGKCEFFMRKKNVDLMLDSLDKFLKDYKVEKSG